jgi:hypothetical protein
VRILSTSGVLTASTLLARLSLQRGDFNDQLGTPSHLRCASRSSLRIRARPSSSFTPDGPPGRCRRCVVKDWTWRPRGMTRKNELMPILPAERDPRLITMRRGETLTDEHHRQLAEWAALCAEHVLHLSTRSSHATPTLVTLSKLVVHGSAAKCACVMRTRPHSWRMPPHMDCPTRRSSPLLRPGKQWRWPTSQPTT